MNKVKDSSIVFINDSKKFLEMMEFIEMFEEISIDMEADGFYAYKAKPCLWQLCVEDHVKKYVFLVDPISWNENCLLPMDQLFGNQNISKLFHGSEYDFQMIYETYNIIPKNVEDTKIAADLLGCESPGLDSLLRDYLGIDIKKTKKLQRANWAKRPLSEKLVNYAALDVLHLADLRNELLKNLEEKKRSEWYFEECLIYQNSIPPIPEEITKQNAHKIKGAKKLNRSQLAILEALFETREAICKKRNLASFRLIGNQELIEIAKNYNVYKDVFPRRMDHRVKSKFIRSIKSLENKKESLPVFSPPKKKKYKKGPENVTKILRDLRLKKSEKIKILPGILLPARVLNAVAIQRPKTLKDLYRIEGMRKWQIETLGQDLIEGISNIR